MESMRYLSFNHKTPNNSSSWLTLRRRRQSTAEWPSMLSAIMHRHVIQQFSFMVKKIVKYDVLQCCLRMCLLWLCRTDCSFAQCDHVSMQGSTARHNPDKTFGIITFTYSQECGALGIEGNDIERELRGLTGSLPKILFDAANQLKSETVRSAVEYYAEFTQHVSQSREMPAELLPSIAEVQEADLVLPEKEEAEVNTTGR